MCLMPKRKIGNTFPYTAFQAEGHRLFYQYRRKLLGSDYPNFKGKYSLTNSEEQ